MAIDACLPALAAHVARLNRHDSGRFTPLWVPTAAQGWVQAGLVRPDAAAAWRGVGGGWRATPAGIFLPAAALDFAARGAAVAAALARIGEGIALPAPRGELYPVLCRWGEEPLFALDRAYVPVLGVKAFGVHLNGILGEGDAARLWVATRASDRAVEPGKRDNLVAGGQPFGLTLEQNLAKEAAEEAGIEAALIRRARGAGCLRYTMETEEGLKPDTLFLYDLRLGASFEPHNRDGEIARFDLLAFEEVLHLVAETDTVKFNVNLVLIDLFLRRGTLGLDARRAQALAAALRPPHPF
jgi:8-oxo-dGTP pyrophosphatase MutT (NUDIX family)